MNDLKNSILILFAFIFAIFGLGNMDFVEQNLINFEPLFFILVALAVLSAFVIVPLTKFSIYQFLFIWAAIYIIIRVIFWQMTLSRAPEIITLEFVLTEISAGLAFDLGRQLRQVSYLLDQFTTLTYPNRTLDLRTAGDRISTELTRSRRYGHPLSVLIVQMEKLKDQQSLEKDVPLQRDILSRFVTARIGQIVNDRARETDLILRDTSSRFILICPETEYSNSTILAKRISKSVAENIGTKVQWGVSSFPDEALTFDDLVEKAMERLREQSAEQIPDTVKA
jgi:GGDEF domain-containing protein